MARSVFERQMRTLAAIGWRTLTLSEYTDRVCSSHSAFLLSFDDGYASLAEHAYPVLADLGFTATTFLITDYVGKTNTWDARYTWRRLAHLDWATIERWRARGLDFASHGATHRRLTWLDAAAVRDELERSRATLRDRLGDDAAVAIAYPFGAVDDRLARLAREAGFALGFGGVREPVGDPLRIARTPVYVWDAFAVPTGLGDGVLGTVGRTLAHVANRCSVGTEVLKGLGTGE